MNRLEELLIKIINKEPIGDWGCENRLEQYLFCIVAKGTPEAEAEYANIRSIDHKVEINGLEAYLDLIYQMTTNDTSGIIGEIIAARLEQVSPESTPETVEIIIPGSKLICSSPRLIAACHVLLRLLMPRHSPCALFRLNFLFTV